MVLDSPRLPNLTGSTASFSKKSHGLVATRVMVDKAGVATIEFRTGIVDDNTNTQIPDGDFRQIEYKVYDVSGKNPKQVLNRTVNFTDKGQDLVSYSQVVPSKNGDTRVDNNPPKADAKDAAQVGPLAFDPTYLIVVTAHLKNVAADPRPDIEVRDTADFFFNPDLDVSAVTIRKVIAGPPAFLVDLPAQVQKATAQPYQVQFFNNPGTGATVGALVTCEVHVFAGTLEINPAITYSWLPNGRPEFNATKAGSAVSDTVTIFPNNTADCRFTMSLPTTGTYHIKVKAVPVYPSDFDLTNNETSSDVSIVDGDPIDPPAGGGGFGTNATADDFYFTGWDGANSFLPIYGDSAQRAQIDKLSSTIVSSSGLSGTFSLTISLSTIDTLGGGSLVAPTATRSLAAAVWTGSLPGLVAAAATASDHCVSSTDGFGSFVVSLAANANRIDALICVVDASETEVSISTNLRWHPIIEGAPAMSTAAGVRQFGDYLIWDTNLRLSDLPAINPVSRAPIALTGGPYRTSGGTFAACKAFFPTAAGAVNCSFPFVAKVRIRRQK
jgi:hypothetical protein